MVGEPAATGLIATPVAVCGDLTFPETPRWHRGQLWFCDIHRHQVLRIDPDGTCQMVATLDDRAGGLGFLPDDTPLVVSMLDKRLLQIAHGRAAPLVDLSWLPAEFLLDMATDGGGRAYIGARNPDSVVLVHPDGSAEIATNDTVSPNGMAVIDDTLVVAETSQGRLAAYQIGPSGRLSGRRIWAEVPGTHPDGICADSEGAVWFGSPPTEEFCRVLEGGVVTHRVSVPGRWGVACAVGDGRLWMTTCRMDISNLTRLGNDRSLDADSQSIGWVEVVSL